VRSGDLERIGDIALAAGVPIHELRAEQTHLEELFFNLTESDQHRNRNLSGHETLPPDLPAPTGAPVSTLAPSQEVDR
jgi:ABC-2 type transport system ATP-binding protein